MNIILGVLFFLAVASNIWIWFTLYEMEKRQLDFRAKFFEFMEDVLKRLEKDEGDANVGDWRDEP